MTEARPPRYAAAELKSFGCALLSAAGMDRPCAEDVADVLLEADLLGHTTHGFALLGPYLEAIRQGKMKLEGMPSVVANHGSAVTWDADYLAGPWVLRRAIGEARARLAEYPVVTWSIRRCHHIACLQAYLKPVTDSGCLILLACFDPSNRWVAPHGGIESVFSPNPIAAGIPTSGDPILVDVSTSTTAVGKCIRATRDGTRLPGNWLMDERGRPTDDPAPLINERKGAIYPLGSEDLGYKGFGLGLLVEALTSALAGFGRADGEDRWSTTVFLHLIDPGRFGGRAAFLRETSFLAEACRRAAVAPGAPAVRLPGERALRSRERQLAEGVTLHTGIMESLRPWAADFDVAVPEAYSSSP